ncbi:hypothetical protein HOD20_00195 [archaeon]|mgnify:FL=1|jgi:hypothetical protein|nr:hypothetical protein [archaeon]MBT4350921.1 hypothetical protein [archaeon]MBT4646947.1 hypothetical protein [archaeon]MBT6821687.1 hypothetical protein [archaeon]MBT7392218.1 hypothetical protein [archaeon]
MKELEQQRLKDKITDPKKEKAKKKIMYYFYALIFLTFFLSITIKDAITVTLFLTFVCSTINYYTNLLFFRLDVGQDFFFSLLVTRLFGVPYGLFLLLTSELVPDIYTARLDKDTIISIIYSVIAIIVLSRFPEANFVILGVILVVIKLIIGIILFFTMGIDIREILFEWGINFLTNMFLFLSFGSFFLNFY